MSMHRRSAVTVTASVSAGHAERDVDGLDLSPTPSDDAVGSAARSRDSSTDDRRMCRDRGWSRCKRPSSSVTRGADGAGLLRRHGDGDARQRPPFWSVDRADDARLGLLRGDRRRKHQAHAPSKRKFPHAHLRKARRAKRDIRSPYSDDVMAIRRMRYRQVNWIRLTEV